MVNRTTIPFVLPLPTLFNQPFGKTLSDKSPWVVINQILMVFSHISTNHSTG